MPAGMLPQTYRPPTSYGAPGSGTGMGMYANTDHPQPSAFGGARPMQPGVMQGMGQRVMTPEMAAQYHRPQMMASALMGSGGAQNWNSAFGPPPASMGGAVSSGPQGNTNAMMGLSPSPSPNMGQVAAQQASMQPQMGIAQPNMQRPMQPPRGYTA